MSGDATGTVPDDLARALDALAAHVRDGGRALVALDFDGALAPLQDDPDASRALPAAVTALARLGTVPGVTLALVSGRGVADLAARAEVPDGTLLVGSHGAERGRVVDGGPERHDLELDEATAARHREITRALVEAVEGTTARVEHKPAAVVLHTRTAEPADAERLTAFALGLGERDGVDAMHGKAVVELAVLHVTKGDALADLRAETRAGALLYAGDDVTDERAFRTLQADDVTIKVGEGDTAARFRVHDPEGLAAALTRLAAALA
ncbi:trehalose-phosphatase [Cellulomonas sp. APG4]|uniref:trehalose-phosphatase n=1 Tax=Cellulomonas sp. APG4 TaxID=1538656 RepID=UPI001379BE78|nr:trehalose-phosphatase [Cellulomonas sp. APG4]NCT92541.1 trehalose-phosphatase [Cellulomonas sp. APG4]